MKSADAAEFINPPWGILQFRMHHHHLSDGNFQKRLIFKEDWQPLRRHSRLFAGSPWTKQSAFAAGSAGKRRARNLFPVDNESSAGWGF
jgi:hypothetical protein